LIGVIAKPGQGDVVEEFFELFKTPWEVCRPGRVYDVIIATTDEVPEVTAKLLLVYGSRTNDDELTGVAARGRRNGAVLTDGSNSLPIYCDLLTFADESEGTPCVRTGSETAVLKRDLTDSTVVRLGYDLFEEVRFLLSQGQPVEYAHIPTLDIHIQMLRTWILEAGIPLLEIPPTPAGHSFIVCLTHDIDFIGIRDHWFDHSMWGFVYRATAGALRNFVRGRLSLKNLFKSWFSVASLPFVYAGWVKDFWEPFEWYLGVEKDLPATYFLIPFKRQAGDHVPGRHASRRATAYDVSDLSHWTNVLQQKGCELGVHGIDSWHSVDKGREELATIAAVTAAPRTGIRMHWLLQNEGTPAALEQAGYSYDSTCGYNETVGYRAGTTQVFRSAGSKTLLELPLHIQDGALFYPQRLDLSEADAHQRCQTLIDSARKLGGVLTVLWHDRSHGPERFWGDFYVRLLAVLRPLDAWFGTAGEVVEWFRKRREVRFEQTDALGRPFSYDGEEIYPPLTVRFHRPTRQHNDDPVGESGPAFIDIPWNRKSAAEIELQIASLLSATSSGVAGYSLP
jgi:hypothetical protein